MSHSMKKNILKILLTLMFAVAIWNGYFQKKETVSISEQKTDILDDTSLYAKAAVLMDGKSGRILFGKNENEFMSNASTTKILTCIIALENTNLDDIVEVSEYAARMPKVKLGVHPKEHYVLRDLIYSMMLESHNDSAVVIAEYIAGSTDKFSKMMNEKASQIGCENSYFLTPNGLDKAVVDENGIERCHGTTAKDLALIMSYCVEHSCCSKDFLQITQTKSYEFHNKIVNDDGSVTDGKRYFQCRNHNVFMEMYDGVISGKTGFTNKSGYCYVGAVKQDDRIFVISLLACGWPGNRSYKWKDAKEVYDYGIRNFKTFNWEEYVSHVKINKKIPVYNGQGKKIDQLVETEVSISDESGVLSGVLNGFDSKEILIRKDEIPNERISLPMSLQAPVKEKQAIGKLTVCLDDYRYEKELLADTSVNSIDAIWCVKQILHKWSL